jgi:hypothetical protein
LSQEVNQEHRDEKNVDFQNENKCQMKSQFGSMYNLPQGNEVNKFASIFSFLISSLHYCVKGQIHNFHYKKNCKGFLK